MAPLFFLRIFILFLFRENHLTQSPIYNTVVDKRRNNMTTYAEPDLFEKINGILVKMSRPKINHIKICGNIHRFLYDLIDEDRYHLLIQPNVFLDSENTFYPDITICDKSKIKHGDVYGAPELVIEVLSPST